MATLKKGINYERFPKGFETLSERESKYYKVMNAKSGVLYITSEPGIAKSAMMRSIAKKLGIQYFDIRLSMVDETDVGLFPTLGEKEMIVTSGDKKKVKFLQHVVPEWAYMANEQPTIIHFEELNRSTLSVRNAALQILLEREIGAFFKFNDNVLMCASGNLGEEDGTDVEEFDQALNNRLIHITHMLPFPEWREQYGDENVHPVIVGFLKTHTEYYYKKPDDKGTKSSRAYATPRSWTFLSDYIFVNYGDMVRATDPAGKELSNADGSEKMIRQWPSVRVFINDLQEIANGYVGPAAVRFIRYCQDTLKITLDDILDRFDEIDTDIKQFNRDKKSELITNMKERKVSVLKAKQIENLTKFLCTISDDEIVGYLLHVLDSEYNLSDDSSKNNKVAEKFLSDKRFAKFRDAIMKHVDDDDSKNEDAKDTTKKTGK